MSAQITNEKMVSCLESFAKIRVDFDTETDEVLYCISLPEQFELQIMSGVSVDSMMYERDDEYFFFRFYDASEDDSCGLYKITFESQSWKDDLESEVRRTVKDWGRYV